MHRCNCSVCRKTGYLHLIVEAEQFKLLSGEAGLTEYRFHTGVARHLFCAHCGIKSFYVPRSHPDAYSVNLNCVVLPDAITVAVEDFDGQNWSKSREQLEQDLA
ncbi:MAG: GFA family protein [Xanthomonadales bacterium]|nr:GFA family protein [Xanthomonadales bacterium]